MEPFTFDFSSTSAPPIVDLHTKQPTTPDSWEDCATEGWTFTLPRTKITETTGTSVQPRSSDAPEPPEPRNPRKLSRSHVHAGTDILSHSDEGWWGCEPLHAARPDPRNQVLPAHDNREKRPFKIQQLEDDCKELNNTTAIKGETAEAPTLTETTQPSVRGVASGQQDQTNDR